MPPITNLRVRAIHRILLKSHLSVTTIYEKTGYQRSEDPVSIPREPFYHGSMVIGVGHEWAIVTVGNRQFIRCRVCGRGPDFWVSALGRSLKAS